MITAISTAQPQKKLPKKQVNFQGEKQEWEVDSIRHSERRMLAAQEAARRGGTIMEENLELARAALARNPDDVDLRAVVIKLRGMIQ